MSRLIYVPQFPTPMRYPEWHINEFEYEFKKHFDEVIVLGKNKLENVNVEYGRIFSPIELSIEYELNQIKEYMELELCDDDILYLADISFPGLFANILHHKKPKKCYSYCHATSKNNYDYFQPVRKSKWKVECGQSNLFDKIFVGSEYHKKKLGWDNTEVVYLPQPPFKFNFIQMFYKNKIRDICSASRPTIQKVNKKLEKKIEKIFGKINRAIFDDWYSYYSYLAQTKTLLISTREETFGLQAMDAILCGCIPIAPNKFSYPELLPREYLYDNEEELIYNIKCVNDGKLEVPELLCQSKVDNFYENIIGIMKG